MDLGSFNDANSGVDGSAGFLTGSTATYGSYTGAFLGTTEPGFLLPGDVTDIGQQAFVPPVAQKQGLPWWESVIAYGFTRAIDNKFGPPQTMGNTQAGSFAGQNGKTYGNAAQAQGRTTTPAGQKQDGLGVVILAGLAALAFMG